MTRVYLNRIATAHPAHDIHKKFVTLAPSLFSNGPNLETFKRIAGLAEINHRYSVLKPHPDPKKLDLDGFYDINHFPHTHIRMRCFEKHAFPLARAAIDGLGLEEMASEISHLIVTSSTGFYAPGPEIRIQAHYKLRNNIQKTFLGFMGDHASLGALRLARHIVRSEPECKILIVNIELCTLHFKKISSVEDLIYFLIFGDGSAASLVSAEPQGLEILAFDNTVVPATEDLITWKIGNQGFDLKLSGQIPAAIASNLTTALKSMDLPEIIEHWAVHPGARSILDAVQLATSLPANKMRPSRKVLEEYGLMSTATIMFTLREIMAAARPGDPGLAIAIGPGLTVETMHFKTAQKII